ncbi:MAG: hypothetical protein WCL04_03995 [Verrucomicrobiota bacterium]
MKDHRTHWIKQFKQSKQFGHLRFKRLSAKGYGYPNFDIEADLMDSVSLEDFIAIETDRIPFFVGTSLAGIIPNPDKIPNFLAEDKMGAILGKSLLSGSIAGLGLYWLEKDKQTKITWFANQPTG